MEKRLLASLLAITPESLFRATKLLGDAGVKVDDQPIIIKDRNALEAVENTTPLIFGPRH